LAALGIEGKESTPVVQGTIQKPTTRPLLAQLRRQRGDLLIEPKILTSWNALYIANKLEASLIEPDYRQEALASLQHLLAQLFVDGVLYHAQRPGHKPHQPGLLEDYAALIWALVQGYRFTLDRSYLDRAKELFHAAKERFFHGGRWYAGSDWRIQVPAPIDDTPYASPVATLLAAALQIADLEKNASLRSHVRKQLERFSAPIFNDPQRYPSLTSVVFRYGYGNLVLFGPRDKLQRAWSKVYRLPYPYLIAAPWSSQGFKACIASRCLHAKSLDSIEAALRARMAPNKEDRWKKIDSSKNR
jgi:uncharacterized protein YyaL (SSP411 family)